MHTSKSLLGSIEATINSGKAIVSADNSIIIALMQEALGSGRSATFYVSPAQAQAVMRWYWTPGRIKEIGMEPVSLEERAKIESELGVKDMGPFFSNRIQCPMCDGVYGAFEIHSAGPPRSRKGLGGSGRGTQERRDPSHQSCSGCFLPQMQPHAFKGPLLQHV